MDEELLRNAKQSGPVGLTVMGFWVVLMWVVPALGILWFLWEFLGLSRLANWTIG